MQPTPNSKDNFIKWLEQLGATHVNLLAKVFSRRGSDGLTDFLKKHYQSVFGSLSVLDLYSILEDMEESGDLALVFGVLTEENISKKKFNGLTSLKEFIKSHLKVSLSEGRIDPASELQTHLDALQRLVKVLYQQGPQGIAVITQINQSMGPFIDKVIAKTKQQTTTLPSNSGIITRENKTKSNKL